MKYSRASYVSGNPQRAVLGCIDRDLIYTCAQTRACHYIFYEILLNPTYSTMSLQTKWPNFSSCLQYEHSCFILNLLAWVTGIPILALGVNHFRISCSAFSLEKKPLFMNRHTKLWLKWAQNPKFCPFTSSFMQNQGNSIFIQLKLEIFWVIIS